MDQIDDSPRNGSNFRDSVPHIKQYTSFCRTPPNTDVTIVEVPFLAEKQNRFALLKGSYYHLMGVLHTAHHFWTPLKRLDCSLEFSSGNGKRGAATKSNLWKIMFSSIKTYSIRPQKQHEDFEQGNNRSCLNKPTWVPFPKCVQQNQALVKAYLVRLFTAGLTCHFIPTQSSEHDTTLHFLFNNPANPLRSPSQSRLGASSLVCCY